MGARTRLSATLALLLCSPVAPALAQPQVDRVAAATAARDAGRTADAIVAFEALAAERPDDPTLLRLLATSYAAARRYDDAAAALARARRLAPADRDIALAQARVALWSGRTRQAAAIAEEIARAEPGNPELPELRRAIGGASAAGGGPGASLAHGLSSVESAGGDRIWRETIAAFDVAAGTRTRLTFEAERADRVFAVDTRLSARADHRFGPGGSLYLGIAATPNADFREDWSLRAGGEARLAPWLSATIDGRYAEYRDAEISALEPGLRFETSDGRHALSVRSINLWDEAGEHRSGWSGRIDSRMSETLALLGGAATYPDTESGITRRVNTVFAGAAVRLSADLDLRLTAEHERRAFTYRRTGVSVGLRWRLGR